MGGFSGKIEALTNGAFDTAKSAVMEIALPLIGLMASWLGIMRLAERSGLVQALARCLRPLMRRLFPDVPDGHPAQGAMVLNMAANMLGLSTHTVHGHSQRIKRKLGVSKLPELLIEGIRRGVIRVTPAEVLLPGFGGLIA